MIRDIDFLIKKLSKTHIGGRRGNEGREDFKSIVSYCTQMKNDLFKEVIASEPLSFYKFQFDGQVLEFGFHLPSEVSYLSGGNMKIVPEMDFILFNKRTDQYYWGVIDKVKVKRDDGEILTQLNVSFTQRVPSIDLTHFQFIPCDISARRMQNAISYFRKKTSCWLTDFILGKTFDNVYDSLPNGIIFTTDKLNDTQKIIIVETLKSKVTIIQGPPGTGKTQISVEIVKQFFKKSQNPILVTAGSNIAVDNIAERLLSDSTISVLRVVAVSKETDYSTGSLEKICLHNKLDELHPGVRDQIKNFDELNEFDRTRDLYLSWKDTIARSTKNIIESADVICSTTTSAAHAALVGLKFPVVVIDEATQATEISVLVPLAKGVEQIVMIGDENQLGPFVHDMDSNLKLSLYERVSNNGMLKTNMLDVQYRMHPAISDFSNCEFYQSKISNGSSAADRPNYSKFPWSSEEFPILFWNNKGYEEGGLGINTNQIFGNGVKKPYDGNKQNTSFKNTGEAEKVLMVIKKLIEHGKCSGEDIGIITPYADQRKLLADMMQKEPMINPERKEIEVDDDEGQILKEEEEDAKRNRERKKKTSKKPVILFVNGFEIATIDAFQGREKDYIIFSTVRSNVQGNIGFVKDERRMNVALTRARYGIIVIGAEDCLSRGGSSWENYITNLKDKDCVAEGESLSNLRILP